MDHEQLLKNCKYCNRIQFGKNMPSTSRAGTKRWSRIEKVPMGIEGKKSHKVMASSRNLVSTEKTKGCADQMSICVAS